jgi:hypothetical protein
MRQDLPPPATLIRYEVTDPHVLPPELGARTGDHLILHGDEVWVCRQVSQRWAKVVREHRDALHPLPPQHMALRSVA